MTILAGPDASWTVGIPLIIMVLIGIGVYFINRELKKAFSKPKEDIIESTRKYYQGLEDKSSQNNS